MCIRDREHKQEVSTMKEKLGLDARYTKTPDLTFGGSAAARALPNWMTSVTKHVGAVVDGRLDSEEGARAVARALVKAGDEEGVRQLFDTSELAYMQKSFVSEAMGKILTHWTDRLA
eukprot:371317-Prymnesium_polylepis.1